MAELQDKIKDLNERIEFKCKRRDAASNVRNYKECDELTEQMSNLKSEKRQLNTELSALTKRQKNPFDIVRERILALKVQMLEVRSPNQSHH